MPKPSKPLDSVEMMVPLAAELTYAEAVAFATIIRRLPPPEELASLWYSALDKISPQLPETRRKGPPGRVG